MARKPCPAFGGWSCAVAILAVAFGLAGLLPRSPDGGDGKHPAIADVGSDADESQLLQVKARPLAGELHVAGGEWREQSATDDAGETWEDQHSQAEVASSGRAPQALSARGRRLQRGRLRPWHAALHARRAARSVRARTRRPWERAALLSLGGEQQRQQPVNILTAQIWEDLWFPFIYRGGACSDSNDGYVDLNGENCSFYAKNPDKCGSYDRLFFKALEACCACQNYQESRFEICYDYYDENTRCQDRDNGAVDTNGYTCAYYCWSPDECGRFDDDDFKAMDMCCGCGETMAACYGGTCSDSDSGAVDLFGRSCAYYCRNPDECSRFDDEDFRSHELCCGCIREHGETMAACYSGNCSDSDNGAFDKRDRSCAYYCRDTDACGRFDDEDFKSHELCCGCIREHGETMSACYSGNCSDSDYGAVDQFGRSCAHYCVNPDHCGRYDDEDFKSLEMCCSCIREHGETMVACHSGDCSDSDNGAWDKFGRSCSWYCRYPGECGLCDDEDFKSLEMCCGCIREHGETMAACHSGNCSDSDNGAVDKHGYSCAYYCMAPESCSWYDDEDFKAMDMCCGCIREHGETMAACYSGNCSDSDNGAVDRDGHTCTYYCREPGECGYYDDEDFKALEMCCGCIREHGETVAACYSGNCSDSDNGAVDSHGYTCAHYCVRPGECGLHDDEDFKSLEMCCGCRDTMAACYSSSCRDSDNGTDDQFGRRCAYYCVNSDQCGKYDDEDFKSLEMCCSCIRENGETTATCHSGDCSDSDNGAVDLYSHSCSYYCLYPDDCGRYDDEDFKSLEMCCGCARQIEETMAACYSGSCGDSDSGAVDLYGRSCMHYCHHPEWCGRFDNDSFTAMEMCCACFNNKGIPPWLDRTSGTEKLLVLAEMADIIYQAGSPTVPIIRERNRTVLKMKKEHYPNITGTVIEDAGYDVGVCMEDYHDGDVLTYIPAFCTFVRKLHPGEYDEEVWQQKAHEGQELSRKFDEQMVVAIRGTHNFAIDVVQDIRYFFLRQFPADALYSELFWAVRDFWGDKYYRNAGLAGFPRRRVLLTGHSLGGYLAEVFASNFNLPGVAFQAPGSDSATALHSGRRLGLSPNTGFQVINGEMDPFGNVFASEPIFPQQPQLYHVVPPIYVMGLMMHSMEAVIARLKLADPLNRTTNRNVRNFASEGQRRRRVGLWLSTQGSCDDGPCPRSIPKCVDDDACLQAQPLWFPAHTCRNSEKHCEGPWAPDMLHCCPATCKRAGFDMSLADCDGANSWEHRKFRYNERQEPWVLHPEDNSCFDSDICLQAALGAEKTCKSSAERCDLPAPEMLHCCPITCMRRSGVPTPYKDTLGLPCSMQPAGRDVDDDNCYRAGRYRANGSHDVSNNMHWRDLSCSIRTKYFKEQCIIELEHKETDLLFSWPVRAKAGLEVQCCPVACESLLKEHLNSKL